MSGSFEAVLMGILDNVYGWVWGVPLLALLFGTGAFLTFILRGLQFRYLGFAFRQIFKKQNENSQGDISHFAALMTSLAGAIGTGNIVGVATAIAIGGLGSMFWMWVTALFGMATKYSESLLAVKYRQMDDRGEMIGGPMQYIEHGLGWKKVAMLFAFLGCIAAIGTGNLVQVNAISDAAQIFYQGNPWFNGVIISIVAGWVIFGGVKSIGNVASFVVSFKALFYVAAGLLVIGLHYDRVPQAFYDIFVSAFSGQAAFGGFAGASIMMAIKMGAARSVFSNEAGLGLPSLAAAAAKTDSPGRQALITMTGALISTLIVCTITGLVIAVTGVQGQLDESGAPINGVAMTVKAFSSTIGGGAYIVSIGLMLFAFTTVMAWGYYGEKCSEYLFGTRAVIPYRIIYTLLIIPGAALKLEAVWVLADIFNGLMAIPNLIALVALSGVIVAETKLFMKVAAAEEESVTAEPVLDLESGNT